MRYFVIAPNGSRYGPADLATLNQWVQEGRLLPDFNLQPEASQASFPAATLAGLSFPAHLRQPDFGSNLSPFPSPSPVMGKRELNTAWTYGALALAASIVGRLGCMVFGVVGLVIGILGLSAARKAQRQGVPNASGAVAFNWVSIGLCILSLIGGSFLGWPFWF